WRQRCPATSVNDQLKSQTASPTTPPEGPAAELNQVQVKDGDGKVQLWKSPTQKSSEKGL
ncbi:MAG: hypothetical protein ABI838_01780, partial [Chloroflexota bacterium]